MRKKFLRLSLAVLAFAFLSASYAFAAAHWSYEGDTGPDFWSRLNPDYEAAMGGAQSPVDIETSSGAGHHGKELRIHYRDGAFSILNNGHTIQLVPADGGENYITLDGERHDLLQFHFHVPSEHKLNGEAREMELHFVNKSASGRLAVMGVLFRGDEANKALDAICGEIPTRHEENERLKPLKNALPITSLLPKNLENIQYNGSLTTPPTTEGVLWIVFTGAVGAAKEQIGSFSAIIGGNARSVQPLNGRLMFAGEAGME